MAIKKISEFVSAVPSSDSRILFEQNEKGKSCTIGDVVNTCSLSYEEIMATTDLSGKVASASAVKHLKPITIYNSYSSNPSTSYVEQTGCRITIPANSIYGIRAMRGFYYAQPMALIITNEPPTSANYNTNTMAYSVNDGSINRIAANTVGFSDNQPLNMYVYAKDYKDVTDGINITHVHAWYITL